MYDDFGNPNLDDFVEDANRPGAPTPVPQNSPAEPEQPAPQYATPPPQPMWTPPQGSGFPVAAPLPQGRSNPVVVLLGCILAVLSLILILQLSQSFGGGMPRGLATGGNAYTDDPRDSAAPDTQTPWGQTQPPANGGDPSGRDSFRGNPGSQTDPRGESGGVMVRIRDGKVEYSEDGGETWSETPPAGMRIPGQR